MTTSRRTIELAVAIDASPAEIWKTLSTAEGIARWFPPIVQGGGAPGSELFLSWGPGIEWRTTNTA